MTREAGRTCWRPDAMLGALLIVIGGALLLDRLDVVHPLALLARYWPASLIGAGIASLLSYSDQRTRF